MRRAVGVRWIMKNSEVVVGGKEKPKRKLKKEARDVGGKPREETHRSQGVEHFKVTTVVEPKALKKSSKMTNPLDG